MPDEQELFVLDYPARQPEEVWEEQHAREVEKDLRTSVDDALAQVG